MDDMYGILPAEYPIGAAAPLSDADIDLHESEQANQLNPNFINLLSFVFGISSLCDATLLTWHQKFSPRMLGLRLAKT